MEARASASSSRRSGVARFMNRKCSVAHHPRSVARSIAGVAARDLRHRSSRSPARCSSPLMPTAPHACSPASVGSRRRIDAWSPRRSAAPARRCDSGSGRSSRAPACSRRPTPPRAQRRRARPCDRAEHERQQREVVEQHLQKRQLHFQAMFLRVRSVGFDRRRRLAAAMPSVPDRSRLLRAASRTSSRRARPCRAGKRDGSGR